MPRMGLSVPFAYHPCTSVQKLSNQESQPKGSLPGLSQSETHMKVKITKKDKSSMTPEEKHLYQNK